MIHSKNNKFIEIIYKQKKSEKIDDHLLNNLTLKIKNYENYLNQNIDDLLTQSQDISMFEKHSYNHEKNMGNLTISPIIQQNKGKRNNFF